MSHIEKEKLIKADIRSIENSVRNAFTQGYDLGFKDGKGKTDYENRLKADKLTMLKELKSYIELMASLETDPPFAEGERYCAELIQQKINELKAEQEET